MELSLILVVSFIFGIVKGMEKSAF